MVAHQDTFTTELAKESITSLVAHHATSEVAPYQVTSDVDQHRYGATQAKTRNLATNPRSYGINGIIKRTWLLLGTMAALCPSIVNQTFTGLAEIRMIKGREGQQQVQFQ